MHQPYTALTLIPTRPATGFHTFPRQTSHHKPIHQRHSPTDTHTNTTHKHSTQSRPRRRCRRIDVDADDTSTLSQPRLRRQLDRPGIRQAAYRIRPNQTRLDQTRPGQAIGFAFDETSVRSPQIFAKPDRKLIRDAISVDAVVDAGARLLAGRLNAPV